MHFHLWFSSHQAQWQRALGVFEQLKITHQPSIVTFSSLIACQEWERSLCFFQDISSSQVQLNLIAVNSLLGAFSEGIQWDRSLVLLQQIGHSLQPDTISYNTCLAALQKEIQWTHALSLLSLLVMPKRLKGIRTDVITYNSLITALEKGQQFQRAMKLFELFDRMKSEKLQEKVEKALPTPDTCTYTSVINVLSQQHLWQDACHKFSSMILNKLQPNIVVYASLITALEIGQRWQKAMLCMQEAMKQLLVPDKITLNASIKAAARGSNWELILSCFRLFHHLNLQPDSYTFTSIVHGLAKAAEWERAFEMLDEAAFHCPLPSETDLAVQAAMNEFRKRTATAKYTRPVQNSKKLRWVFYVLQFA